MRQADRQLVECLNDTLRDGEKQVTVTAPLQVCDLQLQTGQHDQVLLLQEGDASVHTGHLLLQPPCIHG